MQRKRDIGLRYSQNTITIDFNVLDYGLRKQVQYAYLLKGIDDDTWCQANMENYVAFRNRSPGNNTFYVRARMQNQEWSSQTYGISFIIYPPFWFSWWAKLVYVSIFVEIVMAIVSLYRRKLKLENQLYLEKHSHIREQEINKERLQFFTNVTHELRIPLTIILGPLEDLLDIKKQNDGETQKLSLIHKNATRLFDLIN